MSFGRRPIGVVLALVATLLMSVAASAPAGATSGIEIIRTVAGNGQTTSTGDGGPATQASLDYPTYTVEDAAGNFYVSEGFANRVRKVDTAGVITTFAGTGMSGSGGDGGLATGAQLTFPTGLVADHAGNIYISEQNGQRVRRVDHTSGIITTFAGTGVFGYSGDGGPATRAQIANPEGLAVDASGNLYIAQSQYKVVRKVDTAGIITTFAGGGYFAVTGDNGPATSAYIDFPADVAVDAGGNVYIADQGGNVPAAIRKVDTAGIITTVAGGHPRTDPLGDGGPAVNASLATPSGIVVDSAGTTMYIADTSHYRVRKVDTAGIITTVAGTGQPSYSGDIGDNGPPTLATINGPVGVEISARYGLLIVDSGHSRVRQVTTVPDLLQLHQVTSPGPVNVGQTLTYTATITNDGTGSATGVTLKDPLSTSVTFASATASQGTCGWKAAKPVTCALGALAVGATATVKVSVVPKVVGVTANTMTVSANEPDPFLPNNSATVQTSVGAPGCGRVITTSTVLNADLGPCPANGIVIGADHITLDLGGHTIFGYSGPGDGDSAGIRLRSRSGVTVTHGAVSRFDAGVVLDGGAANVVQNLAVHDNIGPDSIGSDLGDGIILFDSASNRIVDNQVVHNGIFDGIGVLGTNADANLIQNNLVQNNIGPSDGGPAGQGIIVNASGLEAFNNATIEGSRVLDNVVRGNGSAGSANINTIGAEVARNVIENNGLKNYDGHGIGLQLGPGLSGVSADAVVHDNQVHGNGGDGIHVRQTATNNRIINNNAADNNALGKGSHPYFDLHDFNVNCDSNVWSGNTWGGGLYTPACAANGGTGPAFPIGIEGPAGSRTCADGLDNDQDGLTDYADPGCQSASAIVNARPLTRQRPR